jgi:hypothetical protein
MVQVFRLLVTVAFYIGRIPLTSESPGGFITESGSETKIEPDIDLI